MAAAFKEWAVVCEALGSGRQSLIIRKGGIAEGRDGFSFRNQTFLLFPTWFHEQLERTTLPATTEIPNPPTDTLEIRFAAMVEWTGVVTDMARVRQLETFHVWQSSVVEERFHYDDMEGIHVAFVRVFRLDPPRIYQNETKYGGCRSWVELPDPDGCAHVSVLSDEEHSQRFAEFRAMLGV